MIKYPKNHKTYKIPPIMLYIKSELQPSILRIFCSYMSKCNDESLSNLDKESEFGLVSRNTSFPAISS